MGQLAFAPDSRTLMVRCDDHRLRVWELATGGLRYRVEDSVLLLAVAPAGPLFATSANRASKEELNQIVLRDWDKSIPRLQPSKRFDADTIWADLASRDAAHAFGRIRELAATPKETLALLDKRLPRIELVKPADLEKLLRQLDDDQFEVRDQARRRLEVLGEVAQSALERALAGNRSLQVRLQIKDLLDLLAGPLLDDRLRFVRAVEILEIIASPESRRLLERLAGGDPGHLLTREARAALKRLSDK